MERPILEALLAKVHGCTFATLDTTTKPDPTITKVETGKRVILFTNQRVNGYENIVKRRLIEAGKNPNNFVLGERPWGSRVPNSPLVEHKGKTYLECIELKEGQAKFFMLGQEADPKFLNLRKDHTPQPGLSPEDAVKVCCYNLDNIDRISLMGEILTADDKGVMRV